MACLKLLRGMSMDSTLNHRDDFFHVMPGLVPGIHAFLCAKAWMAGHKRSSERRSSNGYARP
jgi:hypothetical protein